MDHTGMQQGVFQGRGGFAELGHFDKNFVKKSRKTGPAVKNIEFFWMKNLT